VLSLLRGDAGERALAAWTLSWGPALEVSGSDWQGLYVGVLAADPYEAVRAIAYRSGKKLPGLEGVDYDFLAPPRELQRSGTRIASTWRRARGSGGKRGDAILIDAAGEPMIPKLLELLGQRDDRPVTFAE
jgi:hypothetical protein